MRIRLDEKKKATQVKEIKPFEEINQKVQVKEGSIKRYRENKTIKIKLDIPKERKNSTSKKAGDCTKTYTTG